MKANEKMGGKAMQIRRVAIDTHPENTAFLLREHQRTGDDVPRAGMVISG